MTRVHDIGGRFGDGPVTPEPEEAPVFAEDWHARALAITLACGALGQWNIDTSRHARERLSPKDYTRFTYYEKWIAALADLLVEKGVLTRADLEGKGTAGLHTLAEKALKAADVKTMLAKGGPANRSGGPAPRFSLGQAVRARLPAGNRLIPGGHSRLPRYAAGAAGYIQRLHGSHVLPDRNAHGLGEAPEPLYAVRFSASTLWPHPENPEDDVVLDIWQSCLEPL
ncbi:nitrile hydratase subunit beta [Cribrihabitans pelagius]|uniref:nitrile hydratase subunit beta n=1 Tax=Cribrihabitans pelagius TaxID=1765746 RepID=UPI003B58FADD